MQTLLKFGLVLVALAACVALALSAVPASYVFSYVAPYTIAPDSDDQLRAWVIEQPNVVEHTVLVQRLDDQKLQLIAIVCQNSWWSRPFTGLDKKCAELGYELTRPFEIEK